MRGQNFGFALILLSITSALIGSPIPWWVTAAIGVIGLVVVLFGPKGGK